MIEQGGLIVGGNRFSIDVHKFSCCMKFLRSRYEGARCQHKYKCALEFNISEFKT